MRNKFISRVLAIVLALVCVLTSVPISAFAAETDTASVGAETRRVTFNTDCLDASGAQIKVVKTIKFANGENYTKGTVHYRMTTTDDSGNTVNAYCIEPGVHLNASNLLTIKASEVWNNVLTRNQQLAIQAALAFGAEGSYSTLKKSISGLTFGEAYVATQVIAWEFRDGVRSASAPYALKSGKAGYIDAYCAGGKYPNILKAYNLILDNLTKFQLVPEFTDWQKSSAPTITLKATYNASTKTWNCESVDLYDSNGVLSAYPELIGSFNVGNGTVKISRSGNKATITCSNINTTISGRTVTIEAEKTGIPTTNASGKTAELIAYGASGDVQDVISGYSIDPPNAYLNINIDTSGSYTRDARILKCCYTESEFADDNVNDGEGSLSTSENVEGWYFYVEASSSFSSLYGVDSFILGPTDSTGYTQYLSEYIKENIDPDITHDVPTGIYSFYELGKLKDGADGTDLENDYYFPDNWSPKHKYGDSSPTGSLRLASGNTDLGNIGYANNFFKIPLRVFKVSEVAVALGNFSFTATNNDTGEVFLLRTTKGTGSAYVVGADGKIDPQYAKYNTEDSVYDNFLPEGSYTLHELGKLNDNASVGSRDFENDYAVPAYYDEPTDMSFEVSPAAYRLAQEIGTDTIEVYFHNTVSSYIAIQKKDADTGYAVEGAVYGIYATATAENPLEELVTDENGYAESVYKYPTGTYLIKEIEAPLFYEKDDTVYTVEVVPTYNVDNVVLLNVEDTLIPTSIKIYKYAEGDTNKPLKDAVFGLYSDKNCTKRIETVTTDSTGYATFSPVRPGTFYLKEISAPTYYQKSDKVKEIVISKTTQQDNVVIVYADNPLISSKILLYKTDKNTGEALAGATYGIYSDKACTSLLEKIVTDSEGKATSADDYTPGEVLYIKEISAPPNYQLDTTVFTVTVPKTTNTANYVRVDATDILNTLYIEVYKVDEEDKTPLEGAEFKLYSDAECKTTPLETLVTGTDGKVRTTKAYAPGTYYLKETKAVSGYIKSDDITPVVLSPTSEKNKVVTVERTNPKGETHIAIEKVDKDTKELLAGAVYGLYSDSACTVLSEELTTDENGYAESVKTYPAGTVYLKELVSPDGYKLDETVHTVVVTAEDAVNGTLKGTVVKITVEDEKRPIKIIVVKYDPDPTANGKRLSGAVIGIYEDEACTRLIEELEPTDANKNGEAISKLDYKIGQTVYLKEHKAAEGYKLRDDISELTITEEFVTRSMSSIYNSFVVPENGEDFVLTHYANQANKSYIGIKKTDSRTGKLLANVEFGISNTSDCAWYYYGHIVTDENGYAQSKSLFNPGQTVWIKETATIDGYNTNDTIYEVTIPYSDTDENVVLIEIENDPIITTNITISKTCQQTKLPVANALYRLYNNNVTDSSGAILSSSVISTAQTDANGIATFNVTTVPGTVYYIQEWNMGVPEGYHWSKTIYTVTVTEDMEVIPVTNAIKVGHVDLTKTDSNGNAMPGVTFNMYTSDGKLVTFGNYGESTYYYSKNSTNSTITIPESGTVQFVSMPLGDYYLVETSTVDGYMPYYGKIHFSVKLTASSDTTAEKVSITVPNNLPVTWNTGGDGILPYYYSSLIALVLGITILAIPTIKSARKYKKSH